MSPGERVEVADAGVESTRRAGDDPLQETEIVVIVMRFPADATFEVLSAEEVSSLHSRLLQGPLPPGVPEHVSVLVEELHAVVESIAGGFQVRSPRGLYLELALFQPSGRLTFSRA
ncbi:MAG: hypothetical protein WBG36_04200 [Ornithinimicrobium sp.]